MPEKILTNINWGRWLISSLVFAVLAQIVHTVGAMVSMKYYLDPQYFAVWSKLMMPEAGPPPTSFMYYSFIFSFIGALIFTGLYIFLRNKIFGEVSKTKSGLFYGAMYFLAAVIPYSLTMVLLINLPAGLLICWAAESVIVYLLGGMLAAVINK
ncbi:MAG: hypothetical protein PHD51_01790 [Patescibacteria group bacterium]|nr:hypothetical protein [Patescibacteria group bacterium]MDD5490405.1 hypothetical protein [Patescibacteria group bacterium]